MSVAVVTDSTTYVPAELLDELGVRRVDLYVGWDDDMPAESEWADLDAFYARLQESERTPTTSQPSVGDFTAAYSPLLDNVLDDATVQSIAQRHHAKPAQVALQWLIQQPQVITIPKSSNQLRQQENWEASGVLLSEEDTAQLNRLV